MAIVFLQRPRKPDPRVPVTDKSGLMTFEWTDYFNRLEDYTASLEARIAALEP